MTLWLHMFSWVVLHVLIKSYDLVLPKNNIIIIEAFVMKTIFIQPELSN
jgi:hypothetical protein